ncbi:casein kinase 2 regulatory subunit [Coemansia sp. RSA 1813]|nr:casein kinase 2 regulatory subunit [Coemansia sp. RSA 1646]KAJ1769880.1 casein kinase 2 regulatory subunit [Coemansia sp. RSA 1843]KAJ2088540.1 casein kinase 2 regulatory subunit [Coemansia sp. RSA 986]KAJ2213422.1 casein kinase 2 regulatory subunit [Coemansia sp. RSA 487]KAJ2568317.1 casein kinase 2 regulatory subunit [Coemansia sp. RSA 1813]
MAEGVDSSNGDAASGFRGVFGRNPQGNELQSGLDNTDESDYGEDNYSSGGSTNPSWISWFCSLKGHEYFCEVPDEFIEDEFNLTGLGQTVNYYVEALDMIMDSEDENDEPLDPDEIEAIDSSAEILYGLIHARYILTRHGLCQVADKYDNGDFGKCPRYCCNDTHVVPCGRTDIPERDSVKLFCPSCLDIYSPPSSRYNNVDGAYFGTTLPHMFFREFHSRMPLGPELVYTPRIYGFAINEKSRAGPRMQWLRIRPKDDTDMEGLESSSDGSENSSDSQSYKEARDDAPAEIQDKNIASELPEGDGTSATGANTSNKSMPSTQNQDDPKDESMDLGTDRASPSRSSTPAVSTGNNAGVNEENNDNNSTMMAVSPVSPRATNVNLQSHGRQKDKTSNVAADTDAKAGTGSTHAPTAAAA